MMKTLTAAGIAATVLMFGGSALAQSISVPITNASPSGTFGRFLNNTPNCEVYNAAPRFYEVRTLTVSAAGTYVFSDASPDVDAILGIYDAPFDPADATLNCVTGVDDLSSTNAGAGALTAGTYTVVFSTYMSNATGVATYTYSGPGTLTLGPAVAPAAVPTLTEWAMILLALGLGGIALTAARRRGFG